MSTIRPVGLRDHGCVAISRRRNSSGVKKEDEVPAQLDDPALRSLYKNMLEVEQSFIQLRGAYDVPSHCRNHPAKPLSCLELTFRSCVPADEIGAFVDGIKSASALIIVWLRCADPCSVAVL